VRDPVPDYEVGPEEARAALQACMDAGAEFAELFYEESRRTRFELNEGAVKEGNAGYDRGVGIRAVVGGSSGYAHSVDLRPSALLAAARAAAGIAKRTGGGRVAEPCADRSKPLLERHVEFDECAVEDKADLLRRADRVARSGRPEVAQVYSHYEGHRRTIKVYNSEGRWVEDEVRYSEMVVRVTARRGARRETMSRSGAGDVGANVFDRFSPERLANGAADAAVRLLDAAPAPAGEFPVVLGPGRTGALIHEAVGHALEGDSVTKGTSAYAGRLGETVASRLVTVVDDGSLTYLAGSSRYDDEGVPTGRTVLVERGRLAGYMYDRTWASLAGVAPTGNGRRESFRYPAIPRMTCTFIERGESDPEEIVGGVDFGVYVAGISGGRADLAGGDFVFSAPESYLIRNGRIAEPVRGCTLVGSGREVLANIDAVGNDLVIDPSCAGRCGKGQLVPVSCGQPTVRVKALTVGGSAVGGGGGGRGA